ncbi:hypothetical protein STVIR_6383 [Streptomyces viridochromogenes Tue57]|uniref:Uncharacterized protein n=1 Tax=Streptomyces viridochromogenes Tue57 TaxID=1160705 RepID=L8P941_STRVR|nr:hypothetical protein STVIR_6383 [Streptomyces viridochromogenes Tue57]
MGEAESGQPGHGSGSLFCERQKWAADVAGASVRTCERPPLHPEPSGSPFS